MGERPGLAGTLGRHSPAVLRRYGIDPLPVGPTGVLLRRTGPPAPGAPAPAALDRAATPPPGWPAGPAAEAQGGVGGARRGFGGRPAATLVGGLRGTSGEYAAFIF